MEPFLGEIRMFGGDFAPVGWALCDGSLLSVENNDALFSLLGTQYGGDGQSTFAVPDLRGRVPIQQGQGAGLPNYAIGSRAGEEAVDLETSHLPAHSHAFRASSGGGVANSPIGGLYAGSGSTPLYQQGATGLLDMKTSPPPALGTAGSSTAHNNVMPFQCVSYIIALQGVYPSQS